MVIALTALDESIGSEIDSRFGRAKKFMVYDLEKDSYFFIDNNQNLNSPQGAGIQSAQNVVESGAEAVITGHCGPKAFHVLETAGVPVFLSEKIKLKEAVEKYRKNELKKIGIADVEGHW
jgi:predicted Fe-Mo cluster-binding NifX family protein